MNKVRGGTLDVVCKVYKAGLFRLIGARTNKANKNCGCEFLISARPHYSSIDSAKRPESVHYQQLGPLLVQAVQRQRGQIAELTARAEAAEAWAAVVEARADALEAEMRELRAAVAALSAVARS